MSTQQVLHGTVDSLFHHSQQVFAFHGFASKRVRQAEMNPAGDPRPAKRLSGEWRPAWRLCEVPAATAMLASLLEVPEDSLRGPALSLGRDEHALAAPLIPSRKGLVAASPSPPAERDVPVYADNGLIAPSAALGWTWRPPRLRTGCGAFALWTSRPRGRLQAGDLIYVRIGQPPRIGDTVVTVTDDRVIAIGDLVGFNDLRVLIQETGEEPVSLEREKIELLKVVSVEFA